MSISEHCREVAEKVRETCLACNRPVDAVRLIAVSKTVGVEGAREAFEAGARDFGENRPDELVEKSQAIPEARWHFIGNIQSRRISDIVGAASLIHSLFQFHHAEKINHAAEKLGKVQEVLVEVNVSGEESKSGVNPAEALELVQSCASLPFLRVRGLMTMAPQGDSAVARKTFEGLASLADEIRAQLAPEDAAQFTELSCGMSEDWPEAIACGSTMVRIGRAIFSDSFLK